MRRLIVTNAAKQDLSDIVEYVARSSRDVRLARSFGRDLLGHCTRLATLPGQLGVSRPEYGPDVRAAFHRQYVFMFRYEPGKLRLLRVIEGRRNLIEQSQDGEG